MVEEYMAVAHVFHKDFKYAKPPRIYSLLTELSRWKVLRGGGGGGKTKVGHWQSSLFIIFGYKEHDHNKYEASNFANFGTGFTGL